MIAAELAQRRLVYRDHPFSAFRAVRRSFHEILPIFPPNLELTLLFRSSVTRLQPSGQLQTSRTGGDPNTAACCPAREEKPHISSTLQAARFSDRLRSITRVILSFGAF